MNIMLRSMCAHQSFPNQLQQLVGREQLFLFILTWAKNRREPVRDYVASAAEGTILPAATMMRTVRCGK
jgi:hypothetical protein